MDDSQVTPTPKDENPPAEQPSEAADQPITAITPVEPPAGEIPAEKPAETRLGRFLRMALRWLVLILLLFTLGVVTAYFVLYQPTVKLADSQAAELNQLRQELSDTKTSLQTTQDQVKTLQTQNEQAKADLEKATNRAYLQTVYTDLANARLALANKDGPAARTSLTVAQNDLGKLLPAVSAKHPGLADSLSARLTLILNELNRDPRTAIADLDVLSRNLQDLEKLLFE